MLMLKRAQTWQHEAKPPLDTLRAQMIITKLMALCLMRHWSIWREAAAESTEEDTKAAATVNLIDPPALDDQLAKQLLALIVATLRQSSVAEDESTYRSLRTPNVVSRFQDPPTDPLVWDQSHTLGLDHPAQRTVVGTTSEMLRAVEGIAYYLSASNWSVVYAKLHGKLNQVAHSDDGVDLSELRLLEYCALDRRRLAVVLQGALHVSN
jgi:neurofibromin 1